MAAQNLARERTQKHLFTDTIKTVTSVKVSHEDWDSDVKVLHQKF